MSKQVSAVLAPGESIAQFVIAQLVKGLVIKVTVDGKTYDGYVINTDISPGPKADFLFATVHIPGLDEEEEADGFKTIKVSIHTDGTVNAMPDASSGT